MKHAFRTWFLSVTMLAAVLSLAAATYAWFTSNRAVGTSTATARTGEETLTLQLSSSGGSAFRDMQTAVITQVNRTSATKLLPVSTSDLVNFVYAPSTVADQAVHFEKVENEAYYYHGRIYLRASGEGFSGSQVMNLYLDQSEKLLGKNVDGRLLNAARLGLVFDGDTANPIILRLSEASNPSGMQSNNTVVNGTKLNGSQVLRYRNGSVSAVRDPSVPVADYAMDASSGLPSHTLLSMQIGKIYSLDIYFYLEGCDPDCTDSVSFNTADLQLSFYGVLAGEGSR